YSSLGEPTRGVVYELNRSRRRYGEALAGVLHRPAGSPVGFSSLYRPASRCSTLFHRPVCSGRVNGPVRPAPRPAPAAGVGAGRLGRGAAHFLSRSHTANVCPLPSLAVNSFGRSLPGFA